jgi:membrane associated rhomboid family serine protease
MIPLSDNQPSKTFPFATLSLILLNTYVFVAWQQKLGVDQSVALAGFIPSEYTKGTPGAMTHLLEAMFMHGGWMHLIGNMWFLWVFGKSIENACGVFRYLAFYLLTGVAATGAYAWFSPESSIPLVGASGAISGVLGAYLLRNPSARITTLIPLGILTRIMALPAWFFLLVWIGLQVFSQIATSRMTGHPTGGVAYFAHIGGFVAGMGLIYFFERPEPAPRRRAR